MDRGSGLVAFGSGDRAIGSVLRESGDLAKGVL